MALQIPLVTPNPSLITWCKQCGTSAVGKAEVKPEILRQLGIECKKHEWQAMAPFNGSHTTPKVKIPTVEVNDSPPCNICGNLTQRMGTCYYCRNCNNSSGCS